jgi:hypothetical protein
VYLLSIKKWINLRILLNVVFLASFDCSAVCLIVNLSIVLDILVEMYILELWLHLFVFYLYLNGVTWPAFATPNEIVSMLFVISADLFLFDLFDKPFVQ